MKKALLYIGIVLAAIGCTKDPSADTPLGDNAMTFTTNITTRADKSAWATDDHIGVYMTSTSDDATFGGLGANKDYAYAGSNSFSSTDPLYLPTSGSVKIFAYYPYKDFDNESDFSLTAYPITSSEQVDILSATNDDVSSSSVALQFNHLLSKVSLTIEAGTDVSLADLDELVVTISGIGTKTTAFNLTEPSAAVTFSESTALTFDTSITKDADNNVIAISSSAIVIPQEFNDATLIFTTTTDDKYSATITTDKFVTGLEYSYTITIKESEVTISSATINEWGNGDETSGTADIVDIEYKTDTYYINSAAGLKAFADLVNGVENTTATSAGVTFSTTPDTDIKGVLTRNIDLSDVCDTDNDGTSETNWTPIGKSSTTMFVGTFNGGGYCVSGLYIGSGSKLGLFGYLDTDGLVYNVGVKGTITTTSSESAGIVSYNYGWVMNSYSEVTLNGAVNSGGIAGYNIGNIVNCYNKGKVEGTNNVGGIVGQNAAGGYVGYSFSVGDVSGSDRVGGVVGWNHTTTATAPTIKGCFCLDLDGDDYSIGQLEYVASSGPYDGNMYDSEYLTSEVFATLMNNGASTYNTNKDTDGNPVHTASPVPACAWNDNSTSDYPTLNVSNTEPKYNDDVYDIIYNSGTYEIYTALGLKAFAYLVNGVDIESLADLVTSGNYATYFEGTTARSSIDGLLMDNINLTNEAWTPIGSLKSTPYSGKFNGNGKLVSNLDVSNAQYAGLFGYVNGNTAQISNLGVSGLLSGNGVSSSSDSSNGAVVGRNIGGVITNCYAIINNTSSSNSSNSVYTAGVVGYNTGTIANCFSSGVVVGSSDYVTGGVVGTNGGSIINCYSSAEVYIGKDIWLGGVVGYNDDNGTITSCYWDSSVYSGNGVGSDDNSGSTTVTGYNGTDKDMKDASFITLLNSNAYTYNSGISSTTVTACAWKAVTDGYPTLSFGADPGTTYSMLTDFSETSYPTGNVWYIEDTDATADDATAFEGLEDALEVANTSGNITVIFSNLETLPESAFRDCTYLTSISLPSATTIGDYALRYCTALTSVSLPSATEIGVYAFLSCSSLTSVSLPSATEIGEYAFLSCSSLTSISLPSATKIGEYAFKSCTSLISIELPSAESIESYAFSGCTSLTTLDLGSSGNGISSIGSNAFANITITNIDLTIKIASGSTTVFVRDDGITLTYGDTGGSTAEFKSITVITNWALND